MQAAAARLQRGCKADASGCCADAHSVQIGCRRMQGKLQRTNFKILWNLPTGAMSTALPVLKTTAQHVDPSAEFLCMVAFTTRNGDIRELARNVLIEWAASPVLATQCRLGSATVRDRLEKAIGFCALNPYETFSQNEVIEIETEYGGKMHAVIQGLFWS